MELVSFDFFATCLPWVEFQNKQVLEVCCGDGVFSRDIAKRCARLTGIDPDSGAIARARRKAIRNASFEIGWPEHLSFAPQFDIVVFHSFYRTDASSRKAAISRVVKALKPEGVLIFLEPGEDGSYIRAETLFDAGRGDERALRASACKMLLAHPRLRLLADKTSDVTYRFRSEEDFKRVMKPRRNLEKIYGFLRRFDYRLTAKSRVLIFRPIR